MVTQSALQTFQSEMEKVKKDPYKVVMRQTKQPITLLQPVSVRKVNIVGLLGRGV